MATEPAPSLADLLAIYAVTPDGYDPDRHQEQLHAAFAAGLRCIQLRDKSASPEQLQRLAERWRTLTAAHGALLFINDQADLAAAVSADGVHLGPSDEPLAAVRARHPHLLLGGSASSPDRALLLAGQGADYLGVGAIFPLHKNFGLNFELKTMFMVPTAGVVLAPFIGPVGMF